MTASAGVIVRDAPLAGLLVALLYLLAVAAYPQAALIIDSGRDLAWGLSIARGDALPLYGPGLNGVWQLGPAWYYLLALLLGLSSSTGTTALLLGMLAAAKIPLMYRVGRELKGPAAGLACAAAIALPGWSSLGSLVVSHTMLVETLVLATLWSALLALRRDRIGFALFATVLAALSLHAHPTAAVALPAAAWGVWHTLWRPGRRVWLVLAAAMFALPFLPAIVAEMRSGWPQLHATSDYLGAADYLARLRRLPRVMLGSSVGQLQLVHQFLLPRSVLGTAAVALMALSFVAASLGVVRALRNDVTTRVALAMGALGWLLLLLLRDITPAWMAFACAPLGALLIGVGWQALWPQRWQWRAAACLALVASSLSLLFLVERLRVARGGLQHLPSAALVDIATPPSRDPPVRFWMPAWGHDALARSLCDGSGDASLHGDLAVALNFGQGVAISLHCRATDRVSIGGHAPRNLVGIPRDLALQLRLQGSTTPYGYMLREAKRVVHPRRAVPVMMHTRYRVDDFAALPAVPADASVQVDEACAQGDLLLVTNLLPGLNQPFELIPAPDSEMTPAAARTLASEYFECPTSGRFRLLVRSRDPAAMDIALIANAPTPRR